MKELPTVYPPFYQLPCQRVDHDAEQAAIEQMDVSSETLQKFVEEYFSVYRSVVDEFFDPLAINLPLYRDFPFHTYVVRFGPNLIVVGHKKSNAAVVDVLQFNEIDPPLDSPNILEISKRLAFEHSWFDLSARTYSREEAKIQATRDVLSAVIEHLWRSIPDGTVFEKLCRELIQREAVFFRAEVRARSDIGIDAVADVVLFEPAGFRRIEEWWFQFKHYNSSRLSAAVLRQVEGQLANDESDSRIICLVTSDDVTSIGRHLVNENPRIRVWDRSILNILANKHLHVLRDYFESYPKAVEELSRRLASPDRIVRKSEFESRLRDCPAGRVHFAEYESLGTEILAYLFPDDLGPPRSQEKTFDGKQRRDVLFRNMRESSFFDRLFHRFACDSVIVDFKNYGSPIESSVINDVDRYSNKALGRYVLVVSRDGISESAAATQLRVYRDTNVFVQVVSDADLLEMIDRRDRALRPEDVLEDNLDEFLYSY